MLYATFVNYQDFETDTQFLNVANSDFFVCVFISEDNFAGSELELH